MDPITMAVGTALVGAMATDAWQSVREAVTRFWRQSRADGADSVGSDLETLRAEIVQARAREDRETEQALIGMWRLRLSALLRQDPALAGELERLLTQELTPALGEREQAGVWEVYQNATVSGGINFMSGGDSHVHIRGNPGS